MTDYGPEFALFWSAYPQRPRTRPKEEAHAYWTGAMPLISKRRIQPDEWDRITEGAKAYAILSGDDPYRVNSAKFLYRGMWEGAVEELEEQREAQTPSGRREAYHAWKVKEQDRGGIATLENFDKYMASRNHLKVVG